ncbi:DUF5988 family protein [Cryptosporangium sp. NPDC051539]|uniref:DUF5988 family protein n=1 Tax=Cryptosporangium sp. NPDC051539 TaxID=3363962 RepID=UPI00379E9ADC
MTTTIVFLDGGPSQFLGMSYLAAAGGLDTKIKIEHGNGYEHYAHNGTFRLFDGAKLPVFQWCDRTRIAE